MTELYLVPAAAEKVTTPYPHRFRHQPRQTVECQRCGGVDACVECAGCTSCAKPCDPYCGRCGRPYLIDFGEDADEWTCRHCGLELEECMCL